MSRPVLTLLAVAMSLGLIAEAHAYVIQTVSTFRRGVSQQLRLPVSEANPAVSYYVDVASFPFPASDVRRIVSDSFGAWEAVETSFLAFRDLGEGSFQGATSDGRNTIMYDADGSDLQIPRGTGIIAITRTYWDGQGQISEADIVFNGVEIDFSVNATSTGRGQIDLQSTMTHEIGHFLGLDHSALVGPSSRRPTMNPFSDGIAPREGRSLEADDRAGVTVMYPGPSAADLCSVSGSVTHPDGSGAFGVHVVAYDADTFQFVASTLTGADASGQFEIGGLPAGDYILGIEPLDGNVNHESFGGVYNSPFDTGFATEFYDNVPTQSTASAIVMPAGARLTGFDFIVGFSNTLPPALSVDRLPVSTPDVSGPYSVEVRATDDARVARVTLAYATDGGPERTLEMQAVGDRYAAGIPAQPAGSTVTYRVTATDDEGLTTQIPETGRFRFDVIAFSGEPVLYVAARHQDAVSVVDTGHRREVARIPVGETPLSVVLSEEGDKLFVANSGANSGSGGDGVWVIDTRTHAVLDRIPTGDSPLDLDLSADGRSLYVTNSRDGSVSIVSVLNHAVLRTLPNVTLGQGPYGIADTPDGRLFVADLNGGQLLEVDPQTGSVVLALPVVSSPRSLVVSPTGDRIYVAGFEGDVSVVSPLTGTVIATYETGLERLFRVALSPSGERVYLTDPTNARVLVYQDDRQVQTIQGPIGGQNTRDISVLNDGRTLYFSNQDSDELVVADAATGEIVTTIEVAGGPRGIAVRADPLGVSFDVEVAYRSDFDGSGSVAFSDFLLFARAFGLSSADATFDERFDLDDDQRVGFSDFLLFAGVFGRQLT